MPQLWWEREDLCYRNFRLFSGNQDLQALAESSGTPIFAYSAARIQQNLTRLFDALAKEGVKFKIFYALKANRYLPLITSLKLSGLCGLDVCPPGELLLARQAGFHENEITYTGTSVSNEVIDILANDIELPAVSEGDYLRFSTRAATVLQQFQPLHARKI